MKKTVFLTMVLLISLGVGSLQGAASVQISAMRCEYRVNPLGIQVIQPRLSWIIETPQRAWQQSAYQILVASDEKKLQRNDADLWDSGKIESNATNQIVYKGKPLASEQACYWKVRVWDEAGNVSGWSKSAYWTMGLLKESDWQAHWIGYDASRKRNSKTADISLAKAKWIWYPDAHPAQSAAVGQRYFRYAFELPSGRRVQKAVFAFTADNRYSLYFNGRRTRDGSDYSSAIAVSITDKLRPGKNIIAVQAANEGNAPNPAGLIGVLKITFTEGSPLLITTGASWRCSQTAPPDWMNLDYNDSGWKGVKVLGSVNMAPWKSVKISSGDMFLPPAQYLRKSFTLSKPVRRAVVYASALGNYELHLNGHRVDNSYFTPGWTDYDTRVYYNTYDVTNLLQQDRNVIGAILADGWYSGHIGWKHIRDHYGKDTRFLAQLKVEYTDGTSQVIATDGSWRASTGPILEGDFLMGETYDARREMPGWCTAGFDAGAWQPVDVTWRIDAMLQGYPSVLVRCFQKIKPIEITEPQKNVYVYNMGTNFAGFVRLKVRGPRGQRIVLRFAERLNPDGTIYTTNLRGARATDTYICKGEGEEIWHPRFTFHGFQYVEVTGYPGKPDMDTILGMELTSSTPVVGGFSCSDEIANKLYHNICQTQRANFIDIPTDCPQRDERLGWMGDAQIYVRTATYNTDVSAFFTKWLVDVDDAQLPNGAFTDVSPRKVALGGGTAAWGDAGVICPWTIWQVYGDKRIIAKDYRHMTRWIDYCLGTTKGLLRPAQGYGDWLSIKADTPKDVLATAYFAYSTKLVAQMADALGKTADARKYNQLFHFIKRAFDEAYVAKDGRIKGNTQTVYVLALAFDLLPENLRPAAIRYLVEDINQRGHLSTGFVGTKDLMKTLTKTGQIETAYKLFHNTTFPSWGFSIMNGATSIWERWDGWTPEKGFQNPGMNSFAHYSFGAVGEWMFKTIGGIDSDGPGFRRIIIRPQPGGKLTWAKVSYNSINGKISSNWKRQNGNLQLQVTIPANTTATVFVPADSAEQVKTSPAEASGVKYLRTIKGAVVYEVKSGTYTFQSKMPG